RVEMRDVLVPLGTPYILWPVLVFFVPRPFQDSTADDIKAGTWQARNRLPPGPVFTIALYKEALVPELSGHGLSVETGAHFALKHLRKDQKELFAGIFADRRLESVVSGPVDHPLKNRVAVFVEDGGPPTGTGWRRETPKTISPG